MAASSSSTNLSWKWRLPHNSRLLTLLQTGFQSDLTLILGPGKEEIKVHKLLLITGSKVFFTKIEKSKQLNKLELPDVVPKVFKFVLQYLYTGKSEASLEESLPLLKLATEYELDELRDQCASELRKDLTIESCISMFQGAMDFAHKELIKSSLDFICRNAQGVLARKEFLSLRLECLIEIIQQDNLSVKNETAVFEAVYKWGLAECKRQKFDDSNPAVLQKVLVKALKYVRFPLMDKEGFAMHVATKNVLTSDEALSIVMCFLVPEKNSTALPGGRFSSTPRLYWSTHFLALRVQGTASTYEYPSRGGFPKEDMILFCLDELKQTAKITQILFCKEVFDELSFVSCSGCTHSSNAGNIVVNVTVSVADFIAEDEHSYNKHACYEDDDEYYYQPGYENNIDSPQTQTFSEERKLTALITGPTKEILSYDVKQEIKIEGNKFCKINITVKGTSSCNRFGGYPYKAYARTDNCPYSQPEQFKLSRVMNFIPNQAKIILDQAHCLENTSTSFTIKNYAETGFIAGLRFDYA